MAYYFIEKAIEKLIDKFSEHSGEGLRKFLKGNKILVAVVIILVYAAVSTLREYYKDEPGKLLAQVVEGVYAEPARNNSVKGIVEVKKNEEFGFEPSAIEAEGEKAETSNEKVIKVGGIERKALKTENDLPKDKQSGYIVSSIYEDGKKTAEIKESSEYYVDETTGIITAIQSK